MSRWTFLFASVLIGPLLLASPASAQGPGSCNWCQQCDEEDWRRWDVAAGLTHILYLRQETCYYWDGQGCEDLLPCDEETEHAREQYLELIDRGNWNALVEATAHEEDVVEVVSDRSLLIFRDGCSNAVALREIPVSAVREILRRRTGVDE